ncbi:MAG: hypothetical protein Q8P41_29170 [Pseudomonadota bacterium]|nr:hypothetical protein [Pseudomonadota bacterium]
MPTVGLICEGPTDRAVLERILDGYSRGSVTVSPIQPPNPMRPGVDFGGWQQVFASIRRKDVSGALAFNDLVIVQVDTDVCEQVGFDVPRRNTAHELTEAELTARVCERLYRELAEADPEADRTRVLLAICVNELECWLLLHLSDRKPKTTGCLEAANQALQKENCPRLGTKDNKHLRAYEDAAKGLRRRPAVDALRNRAPSLDAFLVQLDDKLAPLLAD